MLKLPIYYLLSRSLRPVPYDIITITEPMQAEILFPYSKRFARHFNRFLNPCYIK